MAAVMTPSRHVSERMMRACLFPLTIFQWWLNLPALMFLLMLAAMLFRPPDLKALPIDRIAFAAMIALVGLRVLLRRESLRLYSATWPLLGLLLLGFYGALSQPYDPQVWSVFAAKYAVPFVCFHIAGIVFANETSRRELDIFLIAVLIYLSVTSIFFLLDLRSFIFPSFITDEGIGIHADRARGPFLQAVANGLCLNLLGLIALDAFRRRKLPAAFGALLFFAVPIAILATKTRAVWISAFLSVTALVLFASTPRVRKVALGLCIAGAVAAGTLLVYRVNGDSFGERLSDRSPVDFRTEMYRAGWQMFTEKPLLGWGNDWNIQPEVEKHVSSFRPEYYVFHNTFLELAVQSGVLGLSLYAWLMICLLRLRRSDPENVRDGPFVTPHFRVLWPLLLLVYLLNASAVVMNYQFVNAVMFTIAGILAANSERVRSVEGLQYGWAAA